MDRSPGWSPPSRPWAIRVDLDEGRQLRFGPDDLLALAHDPAPYPDHAPLLPTTPSLTAARCVLYKESRYAKPAEVAVRATCTDRSRRPKRPALAAGCCLTLGPVLAQFPDPCRAPPGGPATAGCRSG